MEKKNVFIEILKFGTTAFSIIVTSFFTVGISIVYKTAPIDSGAYAFCDKALYIFLSVVLVQILIQQFFIRESVGISKKAFDDIAYIKNETSSIVFPRNKNKINKEMEDIFESGKANSIKIICYGTSGFGKLIELLYANYKKIKIEVVLCSPNSSILSNQTDKDTLEGVIDDFRKNDVDVHISKIPPTIRASLIYNRNNKPIWCSFQPYFIFFERRQFRGADLTPSIIANENNPVMLKELSEIFEKEFKRLKES